MPGCRRVSMAAIGRLGHSLGGIVMERSFADQGVVGWEKVHSDKRRHTSRLKVPGGWIYMIAPKVAGELNDDKPANTVFVPDHVEVGDVRDLAPAQD
jgi:hypothetical protein